MIRLIWTASIHIRGILRAWLPSNILLDRIRILRRLRWGIPAMLIAIPYLAIAYECTSLVHAGWTGWLNLVALTCIWTAFKFIAMGPISLILLAKARFTEHRLRTRPAAEATATPAPSA